MTVDLEISEITVRFGGIVAVNDASLYAAGSAITGLIGPNGAGKTTMFNVCSGRVRPTQGQVRLGNVTLNAHSSARRAHQGLGRTFQRMELFEALSVRENVRSGPEALFSSNKVYGQFFCSRRETREIRERADRAMERCGIAPLSTKAVCNLSTGQRRLVELARAIATPFKFLLLDEPSSGLDHSETEEFGHILTDFVAETGTGILLVEHDMALVRNVCSQINVLDFGRMIYKGTTSDALASPVVKAAYLGEAADV